MKANRIIALMVILAFCSCKHLDKAIAQETVNLVPMEAGAAPNYWCTWYWQNYLILKGQPVTNPDARAIYSNPAARDELTEKTIFGEQGMARVMLPKTRRDYYFLIDHGWQDKRIEKNTFFTGIMDTIDFPRYAHLTPKDRLKQMNEDIKELGWKGLGLWYRGRLTEEEMRVQIAWSKHAGIGYWKIDGGDTEHYYASKIKKEVYPQLVLEHITGAGPVNPKWDQPGLDYYPSVYSKKELVTQKLQESTTLDGATKKVEASFNAIKNTDVFRTYDAAPLLVSTTTMQRIHDILVETAGKEEYTATLNIQDDCNVAAAMGTLVAVKRHPMKTPRMYQGKDFHLQMAGDRQVDKRLNEMDRLAVWQRIAPPMPAGYGSYLHSAHNLLDSIVFGVNDTWFKRAHGKMVRQSAPAIMSRNIALPDVRTDDIHPYVMASKFPNGAIAVATEGRVTPENSWIAPKAHVFLKEATIETPIGIFGNYTSLSVEFQEGLPESISIWAQDLLAIEAIDITEKVEINGDNIKIPGNLIEEIGTMGNDEGDISAPGLVLKVVSP